LFTGFACGSGPHVVAFSGTTGEIYSWGHNGYCEVGNGSASQCPIPLLVSAALSGRKVIQVASGSHHTLALTSDGEVSLFFFLIVMSISLYHENLQTTLEISFVKKSFFPSWTFCSF
jgi:alpha-tubulin suppressor-like RCC1 family protein